MKLLSYAMLALLFVVSVRAWRNRPRNLPLAEQSRRDDYAPAHDQSPVRF